MTNKEIFEAQQRHKRLTERSKTIVAELESGNQLMKDAAEVIKFQQDQIVSLRRERNEAIREEQRSARDAYEQGRQDETDRNREF